MKTFFTYTAVAEGITGLGLIFIPAKVILLLLATELNGSPDILLAMVAGAAIFSVALASWLARMRPAPLVELKMLMFYNAGISMIFLYGILHLGIGGIVLWSVTIFHLAQTVISIQLLNKIGPAS